MNIDRFSQFKFTPVFVALCGLCAPAVQAEPAGTVLFAPAGVQIIDAAGQFRDAKRGDVLQAGERLVTPANTISQVRLPDGSLVGMRPESVLKLDAPPPGMTQAQQVLSLVQGTVRVIGAELTGQAKPVPITLQTGQATLQLHGADIESAFVRADAKRNAGPAGAPQPGSYNRLAAGSANISNGSNFEALPVGRVMFVSPSNPAPIVMANVAPNMLSSSPPPNSSTGRSNPPSTQSPGNPGNVMRTTSTLTAPQVMGQNGAPMPRGPALGVNPPPVFSPITTSLFPVGPVQPGGQPGPMPMMQPIRPMVMIQQPPPRVPICRPNSVAGRPPICN